MEIKSKTQNDFKLVKALVHLGLFGKNEPQKRLLTFGFIYFVFTSVILLCDVMTQGSDILNYVLILDAVVVVYSVFAYFILPRVQYRSMCKFAGSENEYTFYDDKLFVKTVFKGYDGEGCTEYSVLHSVKETGEYFFIYPDKTRAFVVDKSTLTGGSADEIRSVLQPILGKKYIICNY